MHKTFFIYIFLLFFGPGRVHSQGYQLKDIETDSIISSATINLPNGKYVQTDSLGYFKIPQNISSFEISHIGYKTESFTTNSTIDTYYLIPQNYQLDEVVVSNTKLKKEKLFPSVGLSNLLPKNYGTGAPLHFKESIALYIPNTDTLQVRYISKILLEPTNYRVIDLNSGSTNYNKDAKYAPFKVNIYTYDTTTSLPGKALFTDDFNAELKQGEEYAVVQLNEKDKFVFPNKGIYIVISSYDKDFYSSRGFKSAPAFNSVGQRKNGKYKQYSLNTYEGLWREDYIFIKHGSVYNFGIELEKYK